MKYCNFILILFLALIGCQDVKVPKKPDNLISRGKMVDILTEAYLANAARSVDNRAIIAKGIVIDTLVYSNFGVDSLQFAKSNAYYAADVDQYLELFQKVQARLNAMQTKIDSIKEMERRKKDSIENNVIDEKQKAEPVKDSLI